MKRANFFCAVIFNWADFIIKAHVVTNVAIYYNCYLYDIKSCLDAKQKT